SPSPTTQRTYVAPYDRPTRPPGQVSPCPASSAAPGCPPPPRTWPRGTGACWWPGPCSPRSHPTECAGPTVPSPRWTPSSGPLGFAPSSPTWRPCGYANPGEVCGSRRAVPCASHVFSWPVTGRRPAPSVPTARGAPSPVRSWTSWRRRVASDPVPVDNRRNRLGREGEPGYAVSLSQYETRYTVWPSGDSRDIWTALSGSGRPLCDLEPVYREPALKTPENTYRSSNVTAALGQGCRRPRRRYPCSWRGAGPHRRPRRHGPADLLRSGDHPRGHRSRVDRRADRFCGPSRRGPGRHHGRRGRRD